MPINVTSGSTVQFTVVFFDSNDVLTVPSSATLTVTYSPDGITTASCVIGLTPAGDFFTGTWGSGVAALGIVNYSAIAPGQATATSGSLRVKS